MPTAPTRQQARCRRGRARGKNGVHFALAPVMRAAGNDA